MKLPLTLQYGVTWYSTGMKLEVMPVGGSEGLSGGGSPTSMAQSCFSSSTLDAKLLLKLSPAHTQEKIEKIAK